MTTTADLEVLAAFLRWPKRASALQMEPPPAWVHGLTGASSGIEQEFYSDLDRNRPSGLRFVRAEDLRGLIHTRLLWRPDKGMLWKKVLDSAELEFGTRGARLLLDSNRLLKWLHLQDLLEPECVLLAGLARHGEICPTAARSCVVTVDDKAVRRVVRKGVYDLHVHSGGLRSFSATWRMLRREDLSVDQIAAFANDEQAARIVRAGLSSAAKLFVNNPNTDAATTERRCAIDILQKLGPRQQPDPERDEALTDLERIFLARTELWLRIRQPMSGEPPGLETFRQRYFNPSKRRMGSQGGPTRVPKGAARDLSLVVHDLESTRDPSLRGIEIRMSPLDWPADYERFLRFWNENASDDAGLRVRFAMHVLRTPSHECSDDDVRESLGRQTSAYFLARQAKRVSRKFMRIDVAGPETERSGSIFSPFIGLLLGHKPHVRDLLDLHRRQHDRGIRSDLDRGAAGGAQHWLALLDEHPNLDLMQTGKLGASWHAGEDFGDILAGLYEIATALASGLRSGDTIGHGLALTADPLEQDRSNSFRGFVSRRVALESYLWLHKRADGQDKERLSKLIRDILSDLAPQGGSSFKFRDLSSLHRFFKDARRLPICVRHDRNVDEPIVRLLEASAGDATDWPRQLIERHAELEQFGPLIAKVQRKLRRVLVKRGISVELNPSSNWRIFSPRSLIHLPTIKLAHEMNEGRYAAVCTDNPGTFATSISQEYALLAHGLRELVAQDRSATRTSCDVKAVLERCRRRGRATFRHHATNWRNYQ